MFHPEPKNNLTPITVGCYNIVLSSKLWNQGRKVTKGSSALASLRARSRIYYSPVETVNKVLSLSGFLLLMTAGWFLLCYVRTSIHPRSSESPYTREAAVGLPSIQAQAQSPLSLVFSDPQDKVYYHNPSHILRKVERTALSEEAARRLGLAPCPICIGRGRRSAQSPTETERRGASESAK